MKNKTLIWFLILTTNIVYSQSVITVQHGTTSIFTLSLDSAIIKAQSGDIIYLPGGLISGTATGTYSINKKLIFIGCGYHPDSSYSTGVSFIPAYSLTFDPGSDSSYMCGIYLFGDININSTSIVVSRCNFQNYYIQSDVSNILLSESIVRGDFNGSGLCPNLNVQKNIFYKQVGSSSGGASFVNNVFLFSSTNELLFSISNCLFKNNIFLHSTSNFSQTVTNNIFTNNLFVADSTVVGSQKTSGGNVYNQVANNIFVNYTANAAWSKTQNFHLKPGCLGIGLGTDGTDVGIYGSNSPFKDGGIPFNPHYQSVSIPNAVNSTGLLNINITAKAQNQ